MSYSVCWVSSLDAPGCCVKTFPGPTLCPAQVAIEEVRRLQRFGVTAGELERYKMALLRDSAQAAEQALSVPSADQLDFIMESLALGHTVLDQRQVTLSFCQEMSSGYAPGTL